MEGQITPPEYLEPVPKPKSKAKVAVAVVIVVLVVIILSIVGLQSTNVITIGGVTMREIQLDFDNSNHNYRRYNVNDTAWMVDQISSLKAKNDWIRGDYTVLAFSAKPLPDPDDLRCGRTQVESWFTYEPDDWSTPLDTTFHGEVSVKGNISSAYHVGNKVKILLHFGSIDVPGAFGNEPFTTELIKETFRMLTTDEVQKVW